MGHTLRLTETTTLLENSEITSEWSKVSALPDVEIDLAQAALLIAATEYESLDFDAQRAKLDSMAADVAVRLPAEPDPLFAVNTLSEYLFDELGFRGNQDDYYDPRNSYVNEVLGRRLGIPITLSVVYVEVGKRLGVPLVGVGMPGHFLVKHRDVGDLYIDPFSGGILLSEIECADRMRRLGSADLQWDARYLAPVTNREFVARMLRNLKAIYLERGEDHRAVIVLDRLVTLQPQAAYERRDRGVVLFRLGRYAKALEDLESYLASAPNGPDAAEILHLLERIRTLVSG